MKEVSYMRSLGILKWSWSILWSAAGFMRCVWEHQKDDVNVSYIFSIFQVIPSILYVTVRYEAPRVIWYDCVILYESSELCKRDVLWFMGYDVGVSWAVVILCVFLRYASYASGWEVVESYDVGVSWAVTSLRVLLRYASYAKLYIIVWNCDVNVSWAVVILCVFLRYAGYAKLYIIVWKCDVNMSQAVKFYLRLFGTFCFMRFCTGA